MSWAAHNPEKYDEICQDGIIDWLIKCINELSDPPVDDEDAELLTLVVAVLYQDSRMADALRDAANAEIGQAEADYHGGQIDAVMDRDL